MKSFRILFSVLFAASFSVAAAPVNINTADAELIADSLKGIGLNKAQAIVSWRNSNGEFTSADELLMIKGIGEKTLENVRHEVLLKAVQ